MKKSFNGFIQDVMTELSGTLGSRYTVCRREFPKNNGISQHAIMISDHAHGTAPCYSMEKYYEVYQKTEDVGIIAADILKAYHQESTLEFPTEWIYDKENMLGHVMFRIVSTERNTKILADAPHHDIPDLGISMLFYLLVKKTDEHPATITLWNRTMEMLGTSEAELLERAWKNTLLAMGHAITNINEMLGIWPKESACPAAPMEKPISMYVISNRLKLYGAGCILYPPVLEETAQKLGSGFYVLPSSIHEIIAVPTETLDKRDAGHLKKIVMEINQSVLAYEDILSDNVYYYSEEDHKLILVV